MRFAKYTDDDAKKEAARIAQPGSSLKRYFDDKRVTYIRVMPAVLDDEDRTILWVPEVQHFAMGELVNSKHPISVTVDGEPNVVTELGAELEMDQAPPDFVRACGFGSNYYAWAYEVTPVKDRSGFITGFEYDYDQGPGFYRFSWALWIKVHGDINAKGAKRVSNYDASIRASFGNYFDEERGFVIAVSKSGGKWGAQPYVNLAGPLPARAITAFEKVVGRTSSLLPLSSPLEVQKYADTVRAAYMKLKEEVANGGETGKSVTEPQSRPSRRAPERGAQGARSDFRNEASSQKPAKEPEDYGDGDGGETDEI